MAIQLPNPGLGDGQTGDNEYVMWTKVKDNFSNTTHAASRLVGTGSGNVPVFETDGARTSLAGSGYIGAGVSFAPAITSEDENIKTKEFMRALYAKGSCIVQNGVESNHGKRFATLAYHRSVNTFFSIAVPHITVSNGIKICSGYSSDGTSSGDMILELQTLYSDRNTTKDTATGFLKASSPVLHVYNDSITKIHEAEQLDIVVDKKGVGHYEIHGTTGLRKDDGWFMSPPRDVHGNVLCMVDLEEKDGVIILKTYKKLFDFETVSIVHDYDNPMDIPEGVCVEFRFNDLPEEQLDEPVE